MTPLLTRKSAPIAAPLLALALAIRVWNALTYPADWGFDSSFNWKYILELTRSWALPNPATSWATADPPLFFYLAALAWRALAALGAPANAVLVAVPLLNTAAGLGIAALAVALVRRLQPDEPVRALLAGGLVLFLPAHVQMSVMVNEEIWMALFSSLALFLLATRTPGAAASRERWRAAAAGMAAGLALLAKLTGAVAVLTAAASYALEGLRRRALREASGCVAIALAAAFLGGGWYFARSELLYGYLQPFGLPAHQRMFQLPPGERGLRDFVSFPLATFRDPQLLDPELLHSVWGSTYATLWFDGHRYFLPVEGEGVRRLGMATLLLALLPTAAFGLGLWRGLRRALRGEGCADLPLLLATAIALLGYASYNWKNPWYVVVKGTSLLALCLPFACYASEGLLGWLRSGRGRSAAVWAALAGLALCVGLGTSFDLLFEKHEVSGLPFEALAPAGEPLR